MINIQELENEITNIVAYPHQHMGHHQSNIEMVKDSVRTVAIMNLVNRLEQDIQSRMDLHRQYVEQRMDDKLKEFASKYIFGKFVENSSGKEDEIPF